MTNVSNDGASNEGPSKGQPAHWQLDFDDTFDTVIGLEVDDLVEVGLRTATMLVTPAVCQPMGIVHGGVYAAIAESLASRGTADAVLELGKVPLGMSNNTSFLRPTPAGDSVHGEARAIHRGRTTWLWDVEMRNDAGKLCRDLPGDDRGPRPDHMTAAPQKAAYGFFSFTEVTDPAEHRSYNEWHQLDHLPEQFPLPGIVYGQRWVSTPACHAARAVSDAPLDPIQYVTCYLMAEPIAQTLDDFFALGAEFHRLDRFHQHRQAHLTGPFAVVDTAAAPRALVSAAAVPFRAHRGIYVVVEAVSDAESPALDQAKLLAAEGVAGVWTFLTPATVAPSRRWTAGVHRITVGWLDDDPLAVASRLAPQLAPASNVIFAGPFETITPWEWDWFDESPET